MSDSNQTKPTFPELGSGLHKEWRAMDVQARGPKPETSRPWSLKKKIGTTVVGGLLTAGAIAGGNASINRAVDNMTSTEHISEDQKEAAKRGLAGANALENAPNSELEPNTAGSTNVERETPMPAPTIDHPAIPVPEINPLKKN